MNAEFFIGWDSRERTTWQVCVRSLLKHAAVPPVIRPISTVHLGRMYGRATEIRDGRIFDVPSNAFCATQFSLARFWTPRLCGADWGIFSDGDFLWRADVAGLVECLDPSYALMCVKHDFRPTSEQKMDGQVQTSYERKLWSSLMVFNMRHPANGWLIGGNALNTWTGLQLHQFRWLPDELIGALPQEWNFVPGHSVGEPLAVHLTHGTPELGHDSPFSKEWWSYAP